MTVGAAGSQTLAPIASWTPRKIGGSDADLHRRPGSANMPLARTDAPARMRGLPARLRDLFARARDRQNEHRPPHRPMAAAASTIELTAKPSPTQRTDVSSG